MSQMIINNDDFENDSVFYYAYIKERGDLKPENNMINRILSMSEIVIDNDDFEGNENNLVFYYSEIGEGNAGFFNKK